MKLKNFTVENFRSITVTNTIGLENNSILIGGNNEGKTNILKALNLAMLVLKSKRSTGRRSIGGGIRRSRNLDENKYIYERDYPLSLQADNGKPKETKVSLEFILDSTDSDEFEKNIGSKINSSLTVVVKFKGDEAPKIVIAKKGKATVGFTNKSVKIIEFIAKKIKFTIGVRVFTESEPRKRV